MDNQHRLMRRGSFHRSAATVMPSSSPFFGTYDDMLLLESGLYGRTHSDSRRRIQERMRKMGKSVDQRLIVLLEFFRELYFSRKELLNRLRFRSDQMEFRIIWRSFNGSPRMASAGKEVKPPLRLERLKVSIVNVGDAQGGGGSGPGETKPPGFKWVSLRKHYKFESTVLKLKCKT